MLGIVAVGSRIEASEKILVGPITVHLRNLIRKMACEKVGCTFSVRVKIRRIQAAPTALFEAG
jgi:hypothetical protein